MRRCSLLRSIRSIRGELPLEKLIVITLIIFSGFLILFFVLKVNPDSSRMLCRTSVIQLEYTKGLETAKIANTDSVYDLSCNTRFVDLSSGAQKQSQKKNAYSYRVENKDQLAKVVSEEIGGCWWQMGEGKRNPFGAYANWGGNSRCVVCSEISFDRDLVSKNPTVDVAKHMRENNYKAKDAPGVDVPYKQLLPFGDLTDAYFPPLGLEKDGVSQDYSVVFVMSQTHPYFRWLNLPRLWGCANGALIGGSIGAKGGAAAGAVIGSVVPGAGTAVGAGAIATGGAIIGGVSGCFVGAWGAGAASESIYGAVVGDAQSNLKAYSYSFAKPKGDANFQASVLVVPSGSFEDECDQLY